MRRLPIGTIIATRPTSEGGVCGYVDRIDAVGRKYYTVTRYYASVYGNMSAFRTRKKLFNDVESDAMGKVVVDGNKFLSKLLAAVDDSRRGK